MQTLVFVFNGNGYAKATPNELTQSTANLLNAHGDRAVELTMPAMNGPAAFYQVANQIRSDSKGQPIGLIGLRRGWHAGTCVWLGFPRSMFGSRQVSTHRQI